MNYKLLAIFIMLISVTLITILATYNVTEYSWNSTSLFHQETELYKFRNVLADVLLQALGSIIYLLPIVLLIWSYKLYLGIKIQKIYFRILALIYIFITYPAVIYAISPYKAGIIGMFIFYHLPFVANFIYVILITDILAILFSLSISISGYIIIGQGILLVIFQPFIAMKKCYVNMKNNNKTRKFWRENIEINISPKIPQSVNNDDLDFDSYSDIDEKHTIMKHNNNKELSKISNMPLFNNVANNPMATTNKNYAHTYEINKTANFSGTNNQYSKTDLMNSDMFPAEEDNSNDCFSDAKLSSAYRATLANVINESSTKHPNDKCLELTAQSSGANDDIVSQKNNAAAPINNNYMKKDKKHPYHIPTSLLTDMQPAKTNIARHELQANSKKLEQTMREFGILGKVVNIKTGPVVTLYEITIPAGVKTAKLIALETDIALRMKAISVRIAVVPGKDVIGIEIPNKHRKTVYFKEILSSKEFQNNAMNLPLILGHNTNGHSVVADLAIMPHLLIAGTTGSGKSVGINVMILSLLYKYSPDKCKLIMIDPKMLELSVYQDIPHLLTPVVTDPKQAIIALKWAVKEMEQRYYKMSLLGVRNIISYNDKIKNTQEITTKQSYLQHTQGINISFTYMSYIVVIIDEMADLMMVAGKEVEAAVQRLAQMARAAGIHVIMATQRPSADVITGTIKANFPTRIAFQVSSKIDSRIVLEAQGAEQLLGKGDMLFMPGVGRLQRVHAPFVSDDEVYTIASYLKTIATPQYIESITSEPEISGEMIDNNSNSEIDELYNQAIDIIIKEGKVSTSFLQRRFQIGYNRAARIIEHLEENNIISPASPTGKREILINR